MSTTPFSSSVLEENPTYKNLITENCYRVFRPPYVLEKHVKISTYELTIKLPEMIRTFDVRSLRETFIDSKGDDEKRMDATVINSPVDDSQKLMLPLSWNPGVRFEADSVTSAYAGSSPIIEVVFELPYIPDLRGITVPEIPEKGPYFSVEFLRKVTTNTGAYDLSSSVLESFCKIMGFQRPADIDSSRLPRDLYALPVRLKHRIEKSDCSLSIRPDGISIRLPLYYNGIAVSMRPNSLVTSVEARSIRSLARLISCRGCGNRIVRPESYPLKPRIFHDAATEASTASTNPSLSNLHSRLFLSELERTNSDSGISRNTFGNEPLQIGSLSTEMKTYPLPSEYWLEWSDYWLCHEGEQNISIPDQDFGAVIGRVLMGESLLQLHLGDLDSSCVHMSPPSGATAAYIEAVADSEYLSEVVSPRQSEPRLYNSGKSVATHSHSAYPFPAREIPLFGSRSEFNETTMCDLKCNSCGIPIGTIRVLKARLSQLLCQRLERAVLEEDDIAMDELLQGQVAFDLYEDNVRDSSCSAVIECPFDIPELDSRLAPDADPVVRLFKDRLFLPSVDFVNFVASKKLDHSVIEEMSSFHKLMDDFMADTKLSASASKYIPSMHDKLRISEIVAKTKEFKIFNVFSHYSVTSRLVADLFAASHAHSQYNFLICSANTALTKEVHRTTRKTFDTDIHSSDFNSQRYVDACIALTVINWNSSFRAETGVKDYENAKAVKEIILGPTELFKNFANGNVDFGKSVLSANPNDAYPSVSKSDPFKCSYFERYDRDFIHNKDFPGMQVAYFPLNHPLTNRDIISLNEWQEGKLAQIVYMDDIDIQDVLVKLTLNSDWYPNSFRHSGKSGGIFRMSVLPFCE